MRIVVVVLFSCAPSFSFFRPFLFPQLGRYFSPTGQVILRAFWITMQRYEIPIYQVCDTMRYHAIAEHFYSKHSTFNIEKASVPSDSIAGPSPAKLTLITPPYPGSPRLSKIAFTCLGVNDLQVFSYPISCNSSQSGWQRRIQLMRWFTAVRGILSGKYISPSSFFVYERFIKSSIILIFWSFASKPHTPCFTLIEQALSVFFNVNYI